MASSLQGGVLGQFEGQSDIGRLSRPGACSYDAGQDVYAITGSHFVWKRMAGDFIVTARAELAGAVLGWMARAGLDPASPHVSAQVGGDVPSLLFRRTAGGPSEQVKAPLSNADVVQLERKGTAYIMSVARFGEPFVAVRAETVDLGDDVYVGLFVSPYGEDGAEPATFRDVRIVVPAAEGFDRQKDPFGSHLEIVEIASGRRQIVYSTDYVIEAPNWTRDGEALIYNSGGRLYRFDLEQKTPEPIDTDYVVRNNNDHVLSFDGTMLAISSSSPEENTSIVYTVPVTGGKPKRITPLGPSYLHGWSPDGKYLVYAGLRNGDFDVYRIPADGGEETRLTTAVGLDDGPEYTPDGAYIYFNSVRSGRMQIWRMRPDGSDQQQLTDDEYNNWFPHISPDGRWVVFVTYLVNEVEPSDHPPAKRVYLRLMPLDGGAPRVLAYLYGGQGTMNVPSWSPDSKYVAFVSNTVPRR
jgi:hypothetical protein